MTTPAPQPNPFPPGSPEYVAWALLPLGWRALDVVWAAAGGGCVPVSRQVWTPELNRVGWLLCQWLPLLDPSPLETPLW